MNKADFGLCDACGKPLAARHFSFNRHVEQYHYGQGNNGDDIRGEADAANLPEAIECGLHEIAEIQCR